MRILITGASGVLGRSVVPRLRAGGHEVATPARHELDLFDSGAVARAVRGTDALYHLATRIPPVERMGDPEAWRENDRLRSEASRVLVDAAIPAGTAVFVQPTVALVYPADTTDEDTPLEEVPPHLRSALDAERETRRFAASGGRGVVLRLGVLYGPGASTERDASLGATLHVDDAGQALAAALHVPSGIYNVVEDDNRVTNARFRKAAGWRPRR